NVSLLQAFTELEKNTGYEFTYDRKVIKSELRVDLVGENLKVYDYLLTLSKEGNLYFKQYNNNISVSRNKSNNFKPPVSVIVQTEKVTGRVTSSEDNEGIPGVNVLIKGAGQGTVTDVEGNYSLVVPGEETILVFSSVGFVLQEVNVGTQTVINISLVADITALDEIVVIGYGTQKKVNLTGSVATVSGAELTKRPAVNVESLLQGKVPGLQIASHSGKPGSENNVLRIRGVGTFSGAGSDPLVLINGIAGDMTNLDPNDIETVSVLKDAASSAIYGARAANGVILITTKRGKAGSLSVQYHGNVQFQTATRLPELLSNSADYMQFWNEGRERNGEVPYFSQTEIDAFRNNTNDPINYPNFDWVDHSFSTAVANNHSLSIGGGDEKTTFNVSLGYFNQPGVTSIYEYKKFNARVTIDSKVNDWLKIGGDMQFVKKDIIRSNWDNNDVDYQILAIYGAAPNYTPTMTLPDGTTGYVARYSSNIGEWTVRNPDAQNVSGSLTDERINVIPQFYAEVKLFKDLTWFTKGAITLDDSKRKNHEHAVDNYFFDDGSYAHNNSTWKLGVRDEWRSNSFTTFYSTLNYMKSFGNHNINVLAGFNQESNIYKELRGRRIQFPTIDLKELNAGSAEGQTNYGTANEWAIRSFFGRAAYNFKERYLFEVNARYDGTSRIAPDTRWGFFPSISGAWRISEEAFTQNISWLDNLKLRASWGQLGNQNVGLYPYQEVLSTTSYAFSSAFPGAIMTRMVDETLEWETTTITDIGLDLNVKNGLFTLTFDWFDKITDNILYRIPVPASLGLSAPTVNYGKMQNKGFEFEVGHGQSLGDFRYDIDFNLTHVKNEVLEILTPSIGSRTIIEEGLPFNSYYFVEFDGIFQNQAEIDNSPVHPFNPKPGDLKFKDQNGDNKIDADDRKVVDGAYPSFYYGGSINLSWKNFDLTAFFQGVEGFKMSTQGLTWGLTPYIQGSPPPVDFVNNRWTGDGSTNEHPAMYKSGYGPVTGTRNTYFLLDASYFRLKNLSIAYNFPQIVIQKIRLNGLRVYVSGDNLWTITDWPGSDPERANTNWFQAYPQLTTITTGLVLKF
ncbi:MAG: SusC/RagA family TonB-linked outer membrane protein, partial [Candidatus Scalindua sp.]